LVFVREGSLVVCFSRDLARGGVCGLVLHII
jgi:hypothetical protein